MCQQLFDGSTGQLRRLGERTAFGCHAPDATVRLVSIRITKAGLVMTDDGVIPVANIKRAVWCKLDVHRAKAAVCGLDQRRQIFEHKARTVRADLQRPHSVVYVAADDERTLPGIWKMRRADDVAAAHLAPVPILPDQWRPIVAMVDDEAGNGING